MTAASPTEKVLNPPGLQRLADHWGLVVGYGVVTFGLGVVLAVWPTQTVAICAFVFAIQLLISGIVRIVSAVTADEVDGWLRALGVLSGALAVVIGLMFLRDPLQTLLVVGLMLGAWLLVSGIVDTTSALFGRSVNRVWGAITGLVELVLGCILVVNPSLSLTMLVVLSVLWMLAVGTIAIIGGFALRAQRAPAMVAEPPAPPA